MLALPPVLKLVLHIGLYGNDLLTQLRHAPVVLALLRLEVRTQLLHRRILTSEPHFKSDCWHLLSAHMSETKCKCWYRHIIVLQVCTCTGALVAVQHAHNTCKHQGKHTVSSCSSSPTLPLLMPPDVATVPAEPNESTDLRCGPACSCSRWMAARHLRTSCCSWSRSDASVSTCTDPNTRCHLCFRIKF